MKAKRSNFLAKVRPRVSLSNGSTLNINVLTCVLPLLLLFISIVYDHQTKRMLDPFPTAFLSFMVL